MEHYAHKNKKGQKQKLIKHLLGVASLSRKFADKFGAGDFGYTTGLYHDTGKYSIEFDDRLDGKDIQVDHSTAGAKVVAEKYGDEGRLISYAITGHHSGLLNYGPSYEPGDGTLDGRLSKTIPDYSEYEAEIENFIDELHIPINFDKTTYQGYSFSLAFFTKMLFSCLVDADWLDTEKFMEETDKHTVYPKVYKFLKKLNAYISKFAKPTSFINEKREEIRKECEKATTLPQGILSVTAPTGGGKTISVADLALNHAKIHNLDRIIYVIPYTSITEQSASDLRAIFGEDFVLEHHSNYIFKNSDGEDLKHIELASENWDIPIIVTTNVQFFESLYSHRSFKNRKLHNLSKSVIIFDEVQMFPTGYLKPCLKAIEELVKYYKVTAILCSATLPNFQPYLSLPITEVLSNPRQLYEDFKRVELHDLDTISDEKLINFIKGWNQTLCVVNTKKTAKRIFDKLDVENKYHLSKNMCSKHISEVIKTIKEILGKEDGTECKVVSTSLIETGVHIDFPATFREYAGIDTYIQHSGRCNREGKLPMGHMHVFKLDNNEHFSASVEQAIQITDIIKTRHKDILSFDAVQDYFTMLYKYKGNLDDKNIIKDYSDKGNYNFKDAGEKFRIIEDSGVPIIIPYDSTAEKLIKLIKTKEATRKELRQLQPYIVNVHEKTHEKLEEKGCIEFCELNEIWVLKDFKNNYDIKTGINLPD